MIDPRTPYLCSQTLVDIVKEVDDNTWLIGPKILLSRVELSDPTCLWPDGKGQGFRISDAPDTLPASRPLSAASEIKLFSARENDEAYFHIGECVLKVTFNRFDLDLGCTKEATNLRWLEDHEHTWSFHVPKLHRYVEHDDLGFLFMSRVPGESLERCWQTLDAATKKTIATRLAEICVELAESDSADRMMGVDAKFLNEQFVFALETRYHPPCSSNALEAAIKKHGITVSKTVFANLFLQGETILWDQSSQSVGIVDWFAAGYVPWEWVGTRTRLMNERARFPGWHEWTSLVTDALKAAGFPIMTDYYHAQAATANERLKE